MAGLLNQPFGLLYGAAPADELRPVAIPQGPPLPMLSDEEHRRVVAEFLRSIGQPVGEMVAGLVNYPSEYMQGKATRPPWEWAADLTTALAGGSSIMPSVGNELRMGIKAYHGSPHDFDRFDMSKIGTGEGAQAYGHGLYFAESPGVANAYKKNLSTMQLSRAQRQLDAFGGDVDKAITGLQGEIQRLRDLPNSGNDAARRDHFIAMKEEAIGQLQALKNKGQYNLGKTYEVSINAHPDEFLDWDKPLSEQPRSVQEKVGIATGQPDLPRYIELTEKLDEIAARPSKEHALHPEWQQEWDRIAAERRNLRVDPRILNQTGGQIYESSKIVPGDYRDPEAATRAIMESGIKGIRYKDAGSRGAEGGTSNYVVFDDRIIDILKKYGVAGLIGAGLGPELAKELARQRGLPEGTELY